MVMMDHAHWDCSQGINTSSMLGACWDALDAEKKQIVKHHLDALCPDIFPSHEISSYTQNTLAGKSTICNVDMNGVMNTRSFSKIMEASVKSEPLGLVSTVIASLQEAELEVTDYTTEFIMDKQTMFEIVCIVLSFNQLNIKSVSCSALPMGEGYVEKNGAYLPVPSPSTLRLMIGMRTSPGPQGLTSELIPSCACALLRELTMCEGKQKQLPAVFTPQKVGLGTNITGSQTVRLILGTNDCDEHIIQSVPEPRLWQTDRLDLLEANLDDITAEALAHAIEVLLSHGALDAWITPIVMKKGRPAHTISCICLASKIDITRHLLELMFRRTTTLGVRILRNIERASLRRSFVSVQTPFKDQQRQGLVDVKIGYLGDEIVNIKPEYDHCRAISLQTDVPLQRVSNAAVHELQNMLKLDNLSKTP